MKRIVYACGVLLAVAGSVASAVQAQICIDFTSFCDGLELAVNGRRISGLWVNTDCGGTDMPVVGRVQAGISNPCGATAEAIVVCRSALDCFFPGGGNASFYIQSPLGTPMDFTVDDCGSACCSSLDYTTCLGPCVDGGCSAKSLADAWDDTPSTR